MSRTDVQTIYVARGLTSGLLKIGRTTQLKPRLKAIATRWQEPVETLAVFTDNGMRENALHRTFRSSRVNNAGRGREWFRDDGRIRAFVATLPAHQRPALAATPGTLGLRSQTAVSS